MEEIILLKMGETILKGLNRRTFESRFIKNLKSSLKRVGSFDVTISQSTVYVTPLEDSVDMEHAFKICRQAFGAVAVSRAAVCPKDVNAIYETAKEYLKEELMAAADFKVESKRADKSFPLNSIQLSQEVGGLLQEAYPHLVPKMRSPQLQVDIEIRDAAAYVHARSQSGAGGMPVGSNGRAAVLLSGGIDSPVAAWMMAKRGVELTCIHFFSPPYTSERAKDKVEKLANILTGWTGPMRIYVVPFTEVQEAIRDNVPEEYFTVIMRRSMMRIASALAKKNNCGALITGESLGQVASQTLTALVCTDDVATMPILRPLIGMDKEEIVRISRRIDTFGISILPFEDCCTVFTPKHPRTRPSVEMIEEAEKALEVDDIISEAVENVRKVWIAPGHSNRA